MFATPPCQEQLRLAIVVEAETVPYVVGGSFLCEREELRSCCLLGVEEIQSDLFTSYSFECDASVP